MNSQNNGDSEHVYDVAVVGMGAVVTKNVAPGLVVTGNPAKALKS